jgi:hypothetical protein
MEGLIDTRNEYIEHIQDILSVAISKRIYAIYTEMMEEKKGLKGFQNELYSIRKWNNNIVSDEYKKIVKYTKCKYLSNLIKIIIITTIKIKIYEYREQFDNIKIKIPNPEDFVHKCYINAASFSWKNAYLYNRNNIKDAEYQNNLNIIEENIRAIIKKTFRDFVPFDEIFKQIEDNLTGNVKQFKDTGGGSGGGSVASGSGGDASDGSGSGEDNDSEDDEDSEDSEADEVVEPVTKTVKAAKAAKDTKPAVPVAKNIKAVVKESDASNASEEDEAEDEESEDEAEEESEADEEESEANASEDEADEDEADEDEEEDEAEDNEDNEDNEANASEADEAEESEPITVLKEDTENVYSKINNIVDIPDIPLTKNSNEVYNKQPQEILFKAFSSSGGSGSGSEQTNKQEEERDTSKASNASEETEVPDNIRKEWNSIKDDYHSLSQENTAYKKRYEATTTGTAGAAAANAKYENDNDDAISVASVASARSVASNITDISLIKKIHIKEASNKTKKPSFF